MPLRAVTVVVTDTPPKFTKSSLVSFASATCDHKLKGNQNRDYLKWKFRNTSETTSTYMEGKEVSAQPEQTEREREK